MTYTDITTPSDAIARDHAPGNDRPSRTIAKAVAGVAAGFALGFALASVTADTEVSTVPAPPAVVEAPARPAMSPDALSRWAEADVAPTSRSMSADAAERWYASEADQARIDQAACERLSRGLADC